MDKTKQIIARVDACLEMARVHYGLELPRLECRFDLRGRAAGMFCTRGKLRYFRFNKRMLEANINEFINQVAPHEVAHYVTRMKWGERPASHGPEWKSVMRECYKLTPDRCHEMDTGASAPHVYSCPCKIEFRLSTRMHNGIERGRNRFCKKCKTTLIFVRTEISEAPVIERLFVSLGASPITTRAAVEKLKKIVDDHAVRLLIIDAMTKPEAFRALGAACGLKGESVRVHESPTTIPKTVTHAIIFDEPGSDRPRRMVSAYQNLGVKVRLLAPA